jgi:histidinol-phosphate aminotransferase
MRRLVEPHIQHIHPYVPGLSVSAMRAQFGLDNIVKLASNEGAFGPSPLAIEASSKAIREAHIYPAELSGALKDAICRYLNFPGIDRDHIVVGNGSNELITLMTRSFLSRAEILLNGWPSFMVYRLSAIAMNRDELAVPLDGDMHYDLEGMLKIAKGPKMDRVKLVFLGNPNNPIGHYLTKRQLAHFFENIPPHVIVVIDEAYFEYVDKEDYGSSIEWVLKRPRTAVLRTFSKIFGLAGLRVGYAVCDPEIARVLENIKDPFNVNNVAQAAAIAALHDDAHIQKSRQNNLEQIQKVKEGIRKVGLYVSEGVGNFVLMRLPDHLKSPSAAMEAFLKHGVILRPVANYDLPRYLRVTIGKPHENEVFLSALTDILNHS